MLKKLLFISLISTFLLIGCTESPSNINEEIQEQQTTQTNQLLTTNEPTPVKIDTPVPTLILNNVDISYTNFLQTDSLLVFIDNNNKLSVIEDTIDTPYILQSQISETFDYSIGSITSINNEIFFSNIADNNSLYKLDYRKKEISKVHSGNFHNISSYKNNIFFINKNNGSTLSYLDLKNSKIVSISSDKCGKYLINGDYIIYQNLSDNSSLYSIKIDGSEKTKLIASPVDSFVTYEKNILNINAENNNIYIYNPTTKTNKNLSNINGANLKAYDNNLFYISLSNSNRLYLLEIDNTLENATGTELTKDMVNDYFPTENGIFIKKPIDINKVFLLQYE